MKIVETIKNAGKNITWKKVLIVGAVVGGVVLLGKTMLTDEEQPEAEVIDVEAEAVEEIQENEQTEETV